MSTDAPTNTPIPLAPITPPTVSSQPAFDQLRESLSRRSSVDAVTLVAQFRQWLAEQME